MRGGIQAKLLALVVSSIALSVVLISVVSGSRDAARDAAGQAARLQSSAAVVASTSAAAVAAGDRMAAFTALRAIGQMPGVSYGRIELDDGRVLTETGSGAVLVRDVRMAGGGGPSILGLLQSRTITTSAPVRFENRPVGKVTLTGKLDSVAPLILRSIETSALASLIALAVGVALAWRMQRGISQPIRALTAFMRSIELSHDYRAPLEIEAGGELGQLVGGFNRMLGEVAARDEQIAEQIRTLDSQVRSRTADLEVAKAAAEAANVAKSDFLATMSHEIRTPMNGIMVMAEMLAAGEMPPRQRRFAEVIAKSGSSLLAIINDILDFSKIEAGKLDLESIPLDPCEIVEDVCSLFWERAASKGLDLAAYVDPKTPRLVLGDPVRLRQVITNLVNNAIKFTETGAVMIEIEPIDDGRLRVAVRDTGVGIPKDKIAGVFGAFTQADQSTTRKFGGTGLGLSICKRLVDAMGGPFEVTSTVGKGSTFAFPLRAPMVEAAAPMPDAPEDDAKALVVHTGVATRKVLTRYLEAMGFRPVADDAAHDAVSVILGAPAGLRALAKAGRRICIAEYGETASQALLQEGAAEAVLVQPVRRSELLQLLGQAARGAPMEDPSRRQASTSLDGLAQFQGRRILVADDSAVNREVALEALSRLGIEAVLVEDGRQAVDAALAQPYDAILMDGSMPELDGYDASREIRVREPEVRATRTPIIALTAHLIGDAADAWRAADMDAVLHKPFTLRAMADTLARFLEPSGVTKAPPPTEPAPAPLSVVPAADTPRLFDPEVSGRLAEMARQGRADFVRKIFRLYREQAPAPAAAAAAAVENRDAEVLAKSAHALKSMSLNIGAEAVSKLCATWEADAREGRLPPAGDARALQNLLAQTLDALDGRPATPAPVAPQSEEELLARDLATAIDEDALSLVYQPQFDRDGRFAGSAEALVRWRHPTKGPISPAVFVPIAERCGMVERLTTWVFHRAMRETLNAHALSSVAINASATEFGAPDFVGRVTAILRETGFDPRRLQVEITETAAIEAFDRVRANIEALKALGATVALDDFGAGYTSLQHLRRLPFTKLKLDREFIEDCVDNVESATIVHAVTSVGRALGMKIVAEGVETEAQFKFLRLAGVHLMQGYYFAKPLPLDEVLALQAPPLAQSA